MYRRCSLLLVAVIALVMLATPTLRASAGGLAIIAHPGTPLSRLEVTDLMRLYTGKTRTFPDQSPAQPVSLAAGNSLRAEFDGRILNKSTNQVRAFWAQQIFTGRGTPPPELTSEDDVVAHVSTHPGAIGYVSTARADNRVKTLLVVE